MDSGAWAYTADQTRVLEDRYTNGTLKLTGREWLGEYYENHLSDHAKDLQEALQYYVDHREEIELRGLFAGATYALDLLDGNGTDAPRSSAQEDISRGRSGYTSSLSYYISSPREDIRLPESAVVVAVDTPVQCVVDHDAKSLRESPSPPRKCAIHGFYDEIKHRVGALRFRRWRPRGKKESREKAKTKPSSGPQEEEER